MQNRYAQNEPLLIEKLIAALSYLTSGIVGLLWFLIAIFTKNNLRPFLKYHIIQSFFIATGLLLLAFLINTLGNILSYIPGLNLIIMHISYLLNAPLVSHYSLIDLALGSLVIYLILTSLMGQYSYLPWVSDIIKTNVRNS